MQCYSKAWATIISDACKLKVELPLTSWGCVLYPHQNPLVVLCCLLNFCQRRPQSESALLTDRFWWWSQKGSCWCSLADLNWGIGPWRNKLNIRKKKVWVRSFKTADSSLELCLDAKGGHRAACGVYTVVVSMPKRNELSASDRKEASHSPFVPRCSYCWRLILKRPRTVMILGSLTGTLCCPSFSPESKIHLTNPESPAGQDHCILQPRCSVKKQTTVKFRYCNGSGHNWAAAGKLNWAVLFLWMWECSSDCEETARAVFIAL